MTHIFSPALRPTAGVVLSALACTLFASGCAVEQSDPEPELLVVAQQGIQGGYEDDFDHHVVGLVRLSNQGFGACSGTLIAPNVVLTAQHCVASTSTGGGVQCGLTSFGPPADPGQFFVTTNMVFTQDAADYHRVIEVHIPPSETNDFCGHDQAILILEEPIAETEAIPAVPRVDEPLQADEEYYAVGFGQTSDNGPSGQRRRRDGLFVTCVGEGCGAPQFITPEEYLGDTGICQGDSGGPAFDLYNRVHGVASRGSAGCESPVYGYVQPWGAWIKEVTIYAASLTGSEPPPWATGYPTDPAFSHPVGGACDSSCGTGLCLEEYCTRPCNDLAACPTGYACSEELGVCEELPPPPPVNNDSEEVSSCSFSARSQDPTNPIPWALLPLAGLFWLRRRRA